MCVCSRVEIHKIILISNIYYTLKVIKTNNNHIYFFINLFFNNIFYYSHYSLYIIISNTQLSAHKIIYS